MTEATQRPWAVIQDQFGNESIVDSMGDYVVEMAEQTIDAHEIVKAVNSHDALVAALNDALHIVHVSSDATDLHDALKDWAHSVECDVLPALDQVK